jgi:hypothetical protein
LSFSPSALHPPLLVCVTIMPRAVLWERNTHYVHGGGVLEWAGRCSCKALGTVVARSNAFIPRALQNRLWDPPRLRHRAHYPALCALPDDGRPLRRKKNDPRPDSGTGFSVPISFARGQAQAAVLRPWILVRTARGRSQQGLGRVTSGVRGTTDPEGDTRVSG